MHCLHPRELFAVLPSVREHAIRSLSDPVQLHCLMLASNLLFSVLAPAAVLSPNGFSLALLSMPHDDFVDATSFVQPLLRIPVNKLA